MTSNSQQTIETIELSFSEERNGQSDSEVSTLTNEEKQRKEDSSRIAGAYFNSIGYLLKQHEKQEEKSKRAAALAQVRDKEKKKGRFLIREMVTILDSFDTDRRKKLFNCTICSRHSGLSIVDNSSNCNCNESFAILEKKSEDTAVETILTIDESIIEDESVEKGEDTSTASNNIGSTLPCFEDQESSLEVEISFGEFIIEVVLLLPIAHEVPVINAGTQDSKKLSDVKIDNVKKNIKVMLEQLGRCKYNKSNMPEQLGRCESNKSTMLKNIRLKLNIIVLNKINDLL